MYYTRYSENDRLAFKLMVASLMSLDAFHEALIIIYFYHYAITNFGDYDALQQSTWYVLIEVPITILMGTMIQLFFAWRIYHLSKKNLVIPLVVAILAIAALPPSVLFVTTVWGKELLAATVLGKKWTISIISLELTGDVIIMCSMMYYLQKTKSTFTGTNKILTRMITYSLNTCLLTTVFASLALITFLTLPSNLVYSPFFFILARLYPCSFISTLNSRDGLRQELSHSVQLASLSSGARSTMSHSSRPSVPKRYSVAFTEAPEDAADPRQEDAPWNKGLPRVPSKTNLSTE
ncbi:uncharacterized protein STEHIDRAFT_120022 [Stereum hirsutum FP-91666 SS1]|uniref:uncharacterized protein n=1 Tax=Stereum hirsutum (strain FP-91666) TaxID=721885 RepID=UPI000440C415|nr:uncharacterized protein STEHIDRAFT_120022 [Stereum hirsutum FP-91666 SS1]EIM89378.1 hypothetical protein STEHIDRAFT_120022 [Stereum hirsutum FP-91666 SS1]